MKRNDTLIRIMRVGEVLRRILLALVVPLAALVVFVFFMGNFANLTDAGLVACGIVAVAGIALGLLSLSRRGDYHGAGLLVLSLNVLFGILVNKSWGSLGQLLLVTVTLIDCLAIKWLMSQDFDPEPE